jgi:hypothetical protein
VAGGDSNLRLECAPDVVWKDVGGDIVLVHLRTNRIYELNRTGGRLWTLLEAGTPRSDAEAILAREFDVDAETVRSETDALIEDLVQQQLVVVR